MKTIISYFSKKTSHSGRGGALLTGAFDEDSVQHHTILDCLCATSSLSDEDKLEFRRVTPRSGATAFYDDATRAMGISYRGIIDAFNSWYDSPIWREENSNFLPSLPLASTSGSEKDDHAGLKALIERIELLAPIAALQDRDSEDKSRIFLLAVSVEVCYLQAEAKLSYPYDFAAVVDACHASIRALEAHT